MGIDMTCLYLILIILVGSFGYEDPCDINGHESFPGNSFGSRNEICSPRVPSVCDFYLQEKWYVVEDATILNRCPISGDCGVAFPTWMDGSFPRVEDDIVNQTACIKMTGDCCMENVTISIKNCTSFYVYYLPSLPACPMAYCFESNLPCDPPTTIATSSTQDKHDITTSQVQRGTGNANTDETTAIVIGICVGLTCVIIGCVVLLWLSWTGRLHFKRPPAALAKSQTTVFPHVTSPTRNDLLPPPYSEM